MCHFQMRDKVEILLTWLDMLRLGRPRDMSFSSRALASSAALRTAHPFSGSLLRKRYLKLDARISWGKNLVQNVLTHKEQRSRHESPSTSCRNPITKRRTEQHWWLGCLTGASGKLTSVSTTHRVHVASMTSRTTSMDPGPLWCL
jgi:hypothetical protein